MADNQVQQEQQAGIELPESVSMGVDIVDVDRMRAILRRSPAFARKVFTAQECAYCDATNAPEYHYATRFAAKEAVLKALGTGFANFKIKPLDVEIVLNAKGKPSVHLYRNAAACARSAGISELPVSLSYTHTQAVACAMALTADADATQEKPLSSAEELTRQFKEARAMLDDLPVSGSEKEKPNPNNQEA